QDRGANTKSDGSQKLIGNTEKRPKAVDPTKRINHSLEQEIAPGRTDNSACQYHAGIPGGSSQRFPEVSEEVLQHESSHACAGVKHGENEQRLKHDGEVVPDGLEALHAQRIREDVRHTDGE